MDSQVRQAFNKQKTLLWTMWNLAKVFWKANPYSCVWGPPLDSVHERTVRGGRRRRCVGVVVVVVVVGSSTVIQHPAAAAHLQLRLTIVTFLYTKVTPTLSVCSHHHHQRAPSLHTCANTAVLHTSAVCSFKRYFCNYHKSQMRKLVFTLFLFLLDFIGHFIIVNLCCLYIACSFWTLFK